jgi:hypothetical protein
MAKWYFIPDYVPTDGQSVWVRLYNGYANPFPAVYSTSAQTFTINSSDILPPAPPDIVPIVFPMWMVAKWKART